jgi:hypothetical protein
VARDTNKHILWGISVGVDNDVSRLFQQPYLPLGRVVTNCTVRFRFSDRASTRPISPGQNFDRCRQVDVNHPGPKGIANSLDLGFYPHRVYNHGGFIAEASYLTSEGVGNPPSACAAVESLASTLELRTFVLSSGQ